MTTVQTAAQKDRAAVAGARPRVVVGVDGSVGSQVAVRWAAKVGAALGADIEAVREGHAAEVLLEASRDASLLVLGPRGHGGFSGLLLGSVSDACSRHSVVSVLVAHGEPPV